MSTYSSGRHTALNTQPWVVCSGARGRNDQVEARFASKAEADAALEQPWATTRWVEFDPNPLDAEPLTHVANPILAACREDGLADPEAIRFWLWVLTGDGPRAANSAPHVEHARRVLLRWDSVFAPTAE